VLLFFEVQANEERTSLPLAQQQYGQNPRKEGKEARRRIV